jgi:ATP-dependent Lon protease
MTTEGELPRALLEALDDVPVFPLPEAVLFPRAILPLHIFEPRYRAMLAHCLASHGAMVVARIASAADVDARGQPVFARIAGLGVIARHTPLADGRANILLLGVARVSLEERACDTPFRRARATILADVETPIPESDRAALVAAITSFTTELRRHAAIEFEAPVGASPLELADRCAHHLVFDASSRQALLEELDARERVRRVTVELAMQERALRDGGARRPVN